MIHQNALIALRKGSIHEGKGNQRQKTADHLWLFAEGNHASGKDSHLGRTFQSSKD